tara:strand:- start:12693 stop:13451 length:759 start_codon:yes stop_codon:yes gene_type:complete
MKTRLLSLASILCATLLHAEGPDISSWSITVKGGIAYPVLGEFSGSAGEQTSSSTDDEGNVTTTGNNANINSLSWDDAFKDFMNFAVELDFWEGSSRSLYFGVSRTQATGKTTNLGTYNGSGVSATFSDYSDVGLYAGFRWGLGQPASWIKSLISVQAGATIVDGIDAQVTNIPNYSKIGIYKNTTAFSAGAFVSIIITPLEFFEIGIDSGFQYQTGLDGDNSQLELLGLNGINSEGQLGLVPVRILATIKF